MYNRMINKTVVVLLILLTLFDAAFADDSAKISLYFTIPEVPGLNAPPLTDINTVSQSGINLNDDYVISKDYENQTFSTLEQITQKQIVLADGTNSSLIMQTVYVR